jgi:hypothetical protein
MRTDGIWLRLQSGPVAVANLILERAVAADTGAMLRHH